jgi:putative intracellular protease/amidase
MQSQTVRDPMTAKNSPRVLMPLPLRDFDPTETAVSWKVLRSQGIEVVFATPDGAVAHCDPRMISGEGLDLWGFIPLLEKIKLLGLSLRANRDARLAYAELENDDDFRNPKIYSGLRQDDFDGLLLPGGHAPGMRAYLEDLRLQDLVAAFFERQKPVAAVCHGVVLAARSISRTTGKSVLFGRKTTALTWALENKAWLLMRFFGRVWNAGYYRTYPELAGEPRGYRSVEAEVTRALATPGDFLDVPTAAPNHFRKASGLFRDSAADSRPAFVVRDGNYLSARWPGDVHTFAAQFAGMLIQRSEAKL